MPIDKQKEIFSKNLKHLLDNSGKTQVEIAKDIGVSPQTMNTWVRGIAIPRMGKIQKLADYFGVDKSRLIDDSDNEPKYYINSETAQIAQQIYENPKLRILFDAASDASADDLTTVYSMLMALKRKENPENDDPA